MARPVYISEADHVRVSDAVAQAELSTSGEIVTILTDRSDGYVDVALCWAAAAAFLGLIAFALNADFYLAFYEWITGAWMAEHTPAEVIWLAALFGAVQFAGLMIVQQWTPFRMLLVPGIVKTKRVHGRAVSCFKVGAERRTHGRTGILIYLSMQEHRAEIVADEAIAGKVSDEVWGDAMVNMLGELKEGRIADAMIAAVDSVGTVLAEHFPRAEDDQNELPDRLIEL
ncbi:TPM domain-containing protein [Croceicoccus mobilis]|uniref:TPM domain-containing protein n=1 Tax=Croceicoccus mobilis TaxID=1703339 RepID=A0A917DWD8_9SPHN|nr:TPM domain-containing protein [Croceicoccus mobilis]GGD77862.1 hypothetical protein GCM10010990_29530 [Croceicoccus mobilis]